MASRRGLKARAEQCCHVTAGSRIFEKVWNCHFLSRRWPLAFPALLCLVEEGKRDSKEAMSFFLLHKVMLLVVACKEDSSWAGVKSGGWQREVLDLLEWQWFITRPAELCAFFSCRVWGGACGLLATHLDHPEKGQFRPDVSGGGGGECELFLSQPTPLASGVDAPCS